ncbi:MAG: hypothetical protein R3F49_11890 [Planctomycetota bacterium]
MGESISTVDPAATPRPAEPVVRESGLGVIGVALGVLLLLACVGTLYMLGRSGAQPLDAQAVLSERFERAGPFPFELAVQGASRESGGRELVRLESPRAATVTPARPWPDGDAAAAPDWDGLPSVEGAAPVRAALAWYPLKSAEKVMREQFTALRFDSGHGGDGGGGGGASGGHGGGGSTGGHGGSATSGEPPKAPGPKLQDAGTVSWAGYAAPYVRLREFELDGTSGRFQETVRVNLTTGPRCCVLYLRWAPGELGSREATSELLASLAP